MNRELHRDQLKGYQRPEGRDNRELLPQKVITFCLEYGIFLKIYSKDALQHVNKIIYRAALLKMVKE